MSQSHNIGSKVGSDPSVGREFGLSRNMRAIVDNQLFKKSSESIKDKQIKCLIVNDCAMQATIISTMLKKLNFAVTIAQNGFQALQMITDLNYEGGEVIDFYQFVIMDLNMPIMNGFDSCKGMNEFFQSKKTVKIANLIEDSVVELEFEHLLPVIAACTSDILTD